MRLETAFSIAGREVVLRQLEPVLDLDDLLPGRAPWEVEIGFGKGRYLLGRAAAEPERRFLGIEVVSKYYRLLARRAGRRGYDNLVAVRGEALYLLSVVLPPALASAVHVYFPDPWPKNRHHKRRLFDPESVDLVTRLLVTGGEIFFATDFLDYGERVHKILDGTPGLEVERLDEPWPDGARTHYEAKYMAEGRPILRLRGRLVRDGGRFHPRGRGGILVAPRG